MRLGRVLRLALDELGRSDTDDPGRTAGPPALQAALPITYREGGLGISTAVMPDGLREAPAGIRRMRQGP